MKKKILLLIVVVLFPIFVFAQDILGEGDSIAHGYPDYVGVWPELSTNRGLSETTYNAGVDGIGIATVDTNIASHLSSVAPSHMFLIVGSNDSRWIGTSLSSWTTYLSSIKTKCTSASATMHVNLITPVKSVVDNPYGCTEVGQQAIKLFNAATEQWCYENSIECIPSYADMVRYDSTDYEDDLAVAYAYDNAHLTSDGNTHLASLMIHGAIPTKKRIWGNTSYPDLSYESWAYWFLSGSATISGDSNTGSLVLGSSDTAASNVICLPSGSKTIVIYATAESGTPTIKYRSTASTNFDRDAETSWTTYTDSFSSSDQFIQVQVSGESTISEIRLDWSGSYTPTLPSLPSLHRVNLHRVNMR